MDRWRPKYLAKERVGILLYQWLETKNYHSLGIRIAHEIDQTTLKRLRGHVEALLEKIGKTAQCGVNKRTRNPDTLVWLRAPQETTRKELETYVRNLRDILCKLGIFWNPIVAEVRCLSGRKKQRREKR